MKSIWANTNVNTQIKLEQNQDIQDAIEEEIDRLRIQKENQIKVKQQQQMAMNYNKKIEEQKQQIIKELLPKHKGLRLAYDYDGTYIVSKEQPNIKLPDTQSINKVNSVKTLFQPPQPQSMPVIEKISHQNVKPKREKTQKSDTFDIHQVVKPFENFIPTKGVTLKFEDQQREVVLQQDNHYWGDNIRMTKKQFESMKSLQGQEEKQQQNLRTQMIKETLNNEQKEIEINKLKEFQELQVQQEQDIKQISQKQKQKANTSRKKISKINIVDNALLNELLS